MTAHSEKPRVKKSFRLERDAAEILAALAERDGVSQAAVVERLLLEQRGQVLRASLGAK